MSELIFATSSSSGLGSLGVNFSAFAVQLITFILAYLVLRKYAFGPIVKIMEQRRKVIEDGVKLGEKMRQDETKLETKLEQVMHEARQQADKVIADANDSAKQLVHEAEAKAKSKAEIILKEADIRTKQDLARARRKLEMEMVNLVAQATSAVLDEKVDAKKDAVIIERALSRQEA